jgi:superfamily II DNA or RNA helicase
MNNPSILIAYPDNKIKQSWIDEFALMNYDSSKVTFTTHLSLHKYTDIAYDVVILDEIHHLSENQLLDAYELLKINKVVLGLTGTLARSTRAILLITLGLRVIAEYNIEQAIDEKVITDYEISVLQVPLDSRIKLYKGKTEKQKFDSLSWVIDKLVKEGKDPFFLRLQRMRIIQNSIAKRNKTISLLRDYKDDRVLVFTGLTKIADSLGIPSYHSKSSEKKMFEDFVKGDIKHMAVVKIGNTGVTYPKLNRVIINYSSSSSSDFVQKVMRCMSFDYDNLEKKAYIYIVSSDEQIELNWLKKAMLTLTKDKVKYL